MKSEEAVEQATRSHIQANKLNSEAKYSAKPTLYDMLVSSSDVTCFALEEIHL